MQYFYMRRVTSWSLQFQMNIIVIMLFFEQLEIHAVMLHKIIQSPEDPSLTIILL